MINLYYYLWLFIIYSILGFITEVSYCGIKEGKIINRGFLNGPWCPIYGTGAITILFFLYPIQDKLVLLFIASFVVTSLIEFLTGFVLEKIYKCRWWDYSNRPFNIMGYICIQFSLIWAFVGVVVVKVVNPFILMAIKFVPLVLGVTAMVLVMAVFITDIIVTILSVKHFTSRLKELDRISADIRIISDEMSKMAYKNAVAVHNKGLEYEERLSKLKENYAKKLKEKNVSYTRLMKAFPNLKMKMKSHQEQLDKLKKQHL